MSKIIAIILTLILATTILTACDDPEVSKEKTDPPTTTTEVSKDETFKLNETAVFGKLKITATNIETSSGKQTIKPKSGNTFIGVKFTIENTSNEDQTISSILLFDPYIDDTKGELSFAAVTCFDGDGLDGTIAAGKKMTGYYALEASKSAKVLQLDVKDSWLSNEKASFVFDIPA